MDGVDLTTFVSWILGGGFQVVLRWLVSLWPQLMDQWTETERTIISALAGATIQVGAFVLGVLLGLFPEPEPTVLAWATALFPHLSIAFGIPAVMSTLIRQSSDRRMTARGLEAVEDTRWLGHRW